MENMFLLAKIQAKKLHTKAQRHKGKSAGEDAEMSDTWAIVK